LGSRSYTIGVLLAWRLALTPLLASISSLGVVRELVPGVGLQQLAPADLGDSVHLMMPPTVTISIAATVAVLVTWKAVQSRRRRPPRHDPRRLILASLILTTMPEAFHHPAHGYVGLHIVHRRL
jgi:hypothetical protein